MEKDVLKLSLRAKFLLLSALVQALVVGLLIWNSLRIMDHAVSQNADRVAHEYAVTLNLSLGSYASHGRLSELHSYLDEMLADPADSFVRYIVILDQHERPLVSAGIVPSSLVGQLRGGDVRLVRGLQTVLDGSTLHVRAPMLLQDNQVGTLNFGLSTRELDQAQSEVLSQGGLISLAGFGIGLLLLYVFTLSIGKRLHGLTAQCQRLAHGDYGTLLREHGGDEIEIVSRSLNTMNLALRSRVGELEQAERRLFESEARFKVLFDLAPVPLAVTDREGLIIAANLALQRAFGDSSDVAPGKSWSEAGFWRDGGESRRMFELYRQQGTLQGDIAKVRLASGGAGSVAVWSSSHSLGGDRTLIWALLDLTAELEAKRALEEMNASLESRVQERSKALENANQELSLALDTLQRTQHDLLAAEKMASLGSLVAGIAHELNTPIGNSLLASTTLSDRVGEFRRVIDDGALRRSSLAAHLDEVALASRLISGSLQKAANLIASFKQIAVDQTSDQRRVFELLPAMQDTLTTYLPRLRRANCTATLAIPAGLAMDTYPGSLYQVFSNLLNNALVHAFEQREEGLITVTAADIGNGQVEIVVDDDGAGMTAEVLRHVFDPFFTTKMGQGGTGLGMNIVYNIVNGVLGGRIDIKTRLGLGTTVRIVIPRTAPTGDAGRKPKAAAAG